MPKPDLKPEFDQLESDMIATFLAGHHEWRPDLSYPESYADMQGGIRALLRMYDIKRRPIALPMRHFLGAPREGAEPCDCGTCSA